MLNRLLQVGIHAALPFHEQNKIRVFNTACSLVFCIGCFYFIFGLVCHYYLAVIFTGIYLGSIIMAFGMSHMRKYALAFHFVMICGFLFLSGFTFLFGAYSKSHYYFLFMPVASTILFDSIKVTVKYLVLSIVVAVLNVMFTELMPPYYNIDYLWYFGYPNIVFALLLIFFGLRRFKLENSDYSQKIEEQKFKLEEKNKEMTDSINYARRIQYTLLAHADFLKSNLPEHFVLFRPKDIVSGDFYWAARKNGLFYLAVCDSTGHGVPGAFMSLLNISFLNEALNEKNIAGPDKILDHVRQRLIENISQDGAKDGMDAILLCYDKENGKITYAAANNAPLLIRDNTVQSLERDKMPVGKGEKKDNFTLHHIDIKSGDHLYLFTDGFADQFGGPLGKKFKSRQLENLLLSINDKPVAGQNENLQLIFDNWKGELEQVDDICIMGLKF